MDMNTLLSSKCGTHVKDGYYYCDVYYFLKSLFLLEPFLSVSLSFLGDLFAEFPTWKMSSLLSPFK